MARFRGFQHLAGVGRKGETTLWTNNTRSGTSDPFHLSPCSPGDSSPADVFAVGFEEMVELSAGNIVNAR